MGDQFQRLKVLRGILDTTNAQYVECPSCKKIMGFTDTREDGYIECKYCGLEMNIERHRAWENRVIKEFPCHAPTRYRVAWSWDCRYVTGMYFYLDGRLAWIGERFAGIIFDEDNLETWA